MKIGSLVAFILKSSIIFCSFIVIAQAQFENNPLSRAIDNTEYDVINFSPGWQATTSSSTAGGDAAISEIISGDNMAIMSIEYLDTIGRGGRLSFDWKVTETSLDDQLLFTIITPSGSSLLSERIFFARDWESVSVEIPDQDVILVWAYFESDQFEAPLRESNGRGWVDNVKISQNGAGLPPACTTFQSNLNSALDNNQYEILGSGFICQAEDFTFGGSAAQSNPDTIRFATRQMTTEVVGPVDLIFDWRIDAGSEDLFELSIDFENIDILSGSTEWTTRRISVPKGEHVIRWFYRRFSQTETNTNSGYVDYLRTAEFTNIREGDVIVIAPVINYLLSE